MKDLTFKLLLGIIAVNLTIQTVKDVGLFPTAYAQADQQVQICGYEDRSARDMNGLFGCAEVIDGQLSVSVLGF
jgi:hypothetical protein